VFTLPCASTTKPTAVDLPLHVIGPYSALATIATATTAKGDSIASALSFPHGPPPSLPLSLSDPLGLDSIPWYYGSGSSAVLLSVALISTLQLFRRRYPPWQPAPSLLPTGQEKIRPSGEHCAFKSAVWLQMVALIGLNTAGLDLLISFHSLNRAWLESHTSSKDPAVWISRAGRVGPPLTVVTWGVLLGLIRAFVCLLCGIRKIPPPPPPSTHRERQPAEGKEGEQQARTRYYFKRHLSLEIAGLVLPAISLAALFTKGWIRSAAQSSRDRTEPAFPVDFMPALYWDGMGEATHARYVLFAGAVGALCIYAPALVFLASLPRRYIKRQVLELGFGAVVVLSALAVTAVVVVTLIQGLWCALTDHCAMTLLKKPVAEAISSGVAWVFAVGMAPLITLYGILLMPVAVLWYSLRGWVFGTTDVRRSCFFIPCTEATSKGLDWGQFIVVASCCGLVAYNIYLVAGDWRGTTQPGGLRVPRVWKRRNAVVSLNQRTT